MLTWSEMTKLVQILQADWVLAEFRSALAVTDCPCVPRLSLCAMKENYMYIYMYIYIFKYVYIYI